MGARLVSLALTRWSHVSDRAFRVLVRMALTALDEPNNGTPANLYFGGRDLLAMTLRADGGQPQTRYRVVKRLLAELTKEGAIERTQAGRAGQNAVYRLTLHSVRAIDELPLDDAPAQGNQGGREDPPEGGSQDPPQGGSGVSSRGVPGAPPRNHDEPIEELWEERKPVDLDTAVTVTRTHEADTNPNSPPHLTLVEGNPDRPEPAPHGRPLWPTPAPMPERPRPAGATGNGFCVSCYADGQVTVAADPQYGTACAKHLREAG